MPSATLEIVSVEKQEKSYRITARGPTGDWTFRAKHDKGQGLRAEMVVYLTYSINEFKGEKYKWIDSWIQAEGTIAPTSPKATVDRAPWSQANKPKSTIEAENIFVTGIVGRSMQSGQFRIDQIPELLETARRAWRGEGSVSGLKEEEFE